MEAERLLTTRRVFDGKILGLRVDSVGLASGRQTVREVVEHGASVVVVPIDGQDNVVLVRQYRYAAGATLLEAPAGMVEGAETPEACAQRELQEETGYRSGDLKPLGGFWTSPGFCTEYIHAFVATDLSEDGLPQDDDEAIATVRVPLAKIGALIRSGEIEDAKTMAALLMTGRV